MALVKSQADKVAVLSAWCTSLEGKISEWKSSVTELRYELSALQNQAANIQTAVVAHVDAGASTTGPVQELESSFL